MQNKILQWVIIWSLSVFYNFLVSFRILYSLVKNGWKALETKDRSNRPSILTDPKLGQHKYVVLEKRGMRIHYVENGNSNKPLVVLLHGFPECWLMWRNQLQGLSDQFRVVAVDMPGYGDSDKPPRKSDYTNDKLVACLRDFVIALGASSDNKCTLIGHDWGGVLCWVLVEKHPELFHHHVNINAPHPYVMNVLLHSSIKQFFKSWYVFMFQMPYLPEILLKLDDHASLSGLKGKHDDDSSFPDEVVESYKYYFSKKGGYTAPLNYYRCSFNEDPKEPAEKIKVPTLILWGENDNYLSYQIPLNILPYCEKVELQKIKNCQHFVPECKPEIVTNAIRTFIS